MRTINAQPGLVDQVYDAILAEIVDGQFPSGTRLIQDELAQAYGVSRQPVQQALLLARNHGLVRDAQGRGLVVAALDVEFVRNLYEVRAVLEGLSARMAAAHGADRARAEGPERLAHGRAAVESGSLTGQIAADMAFHAFLAELSGNLLIGETTAPHWHHLRRVMGAVLREDDKMPRNIWDEHEAILGAVITGDGTTAEALSRQHILRAAKIFVERLQAQHDASKEDIEGRRLRRIQR